MRLTELSIGRAIACINVVEKSAIFGYNNHTYIGYITNLIGYIECLVANAMLSPLLGSENCERVLIFILARNQGYATEIANFFGTSLYAIQKQLEKLENGGVLVSHTAGRTRIYRFNPRYPFLKELSAILQKALSFYPMELRDKLLMNRRRPRRRKKPL